jgi:hypothetical protein
MVNPFQGSEGSSNNDRGTFKSFPSLITQDALLVFFIHSKSQLEVETLVLLMLPLTSSEVRNYQRELKSLLRDSLGVTDQLDKFLGPQIYTWTELMPILGTLHLREERIMIRRAAMAIWEREHPPTGSWS